MSMFAVLVPNNPDLTILAGIVKEELNAVRISVVSSLSQEISVTYESLENFRKNYCESCCRYSRNFDGFESKLSPVDFIDFETYSQQLEQEFNTWVEDREGKVCSGGKDLVYEDECPEYNYEDVVELKEAFHTTLPHIYQYTITPGLNGITEYSLREDHLFALDGYQINPDNGEMDLRTAPYQLSNVFSDGNICWGDHPLSSNMRKQYSLFWTSTFNGDLIPGDVNLQHWIETFHKRKHYYLDWDWVPASQVFGTKRISSAEQSSNLPVEGVLIIPDKESTLNTRLTWIFKEDNNYFAYLEEGVPSSRINMGSSLSYYQLKVD